VILGGFGVEEGTMAQGGEQPQGEVTEWSSSEVAAEVLNSKSVVIVPGYGMAVARCRQQVAGIAEELRKRGIPVKFAIHPVAGRMPGHMNVLLAESNVAYDKLVEMEEINEEFATADVVYVVGANDVVNPAARHDPSSPIYGMPILDVDKAKTVIVSKRSMAAGYANIENELFGYSNCMMLFGDAKKTLTEVVAELKAM
jgi:NAD(P) transhydrogenase subunit beta